MALMIALLLALARTQVVKSQVLDVPAVADISHQQEDTRLIGQRLTYECSGSSSSIPIFLRGPGHPIEITSPNYPNSFTSTLLDCSWDIKALHGANVKVSVIETSLNEGCVDNKLTILDDTPENKNS